MGQYITTNICYSFEVCKKDLLELKVDVKQFEKSMTKKLDLKLYQRIDGNEDNYIWNLKSSYLEDELAGFLAQQYTLMDLDKCYRGEEIIEKLENLKKAKEIIDFAEGKLSIWNDLFS